MEFLNGLSDNQTALLGCAIALLMSGTMMSLSYYVGRLFQRVKQQQQSPEPTEPQTLRMPKPMALRSHAAHTSATPTPHGSVRRAA